MTRPIKNTHSALDLTLGALADPTRRGILDLLRTHGEMTAGEIGDQVPTMSRPAVSKHLRILRESALVEEERAGRFVIYRLPSRQVGQPIEEWLGPFRAMWREKLLDLKRFVETDERIESGQRDH